MAKIKYSNQQLIKGLLGGASGSNSIVTITKTGRIKLVKHEDRREKRKRKRQES